MSRQRVFVQNMRYRAAEFRAAGRADLAAVMDGWVEDTQLAEMMGIDYTAVHCSSCGADIPPATIGYCPVCGADPLPF